LRPWRVRDGKRRGRYMGTRAEIYVRSSFGVIGLWKHYDGNPEYMLEFFERFLKYAVENWKPQPHWLTYPEDVSALLITYEYIDRLEGVKEHWGKKLDKDPFLRAMATHVDIRPFFDIRNGRMINDLEYLYILDLPESIIDGKAEFTVRCYEIQHGFGYDNDKEIFEQIELKGRIEHPKFRKVAEKKFVFDL